MSEDDFITLLARCPPEARLFYVAQAVLQRVLQAQQLKIVPGSNRHPAAHYGSIYERRLERLLEMGEPLPPGMAETTAWFRRYSGLVDGGYATIDGDDVVYFFTDEEGRLRGCITGP